MSAVHRLTWVVDIEGYGPRGHHAHTELQQRLQWVITQTLRLASVRQAACDRQERGDGVLLLLPPLIEQDRVLPVLLTGLRDVLHEANRASRSAGRLRLRSALAQGAVERGATGFQGQSVILACYLLDAPEAKAALAASDDSDLVTVVSEDLHRDIFQQGFVTASFEDFTLSRPEKRFAATGWLHLSGPGRVDPRVPAYAPPARDPRTPRDRKTDSVFSLLISASSAASLFTTAHDLADDLRDLSSGHHDTPHEDDHDDLAHPPPHDPSEDSSFHDAHAHSGHHDAHDHDHHETHDDDWHHH